MVYTYSGLYNLTSAGISVVKGERNATNKDLLEYFEILDKLSSRDLVGNSARDAISQFVSQFVETDEFLMILDGSLNIGMNASSINKAIPDLISKFSVILAKKYEGKLFMNTLASQKFDGVRCIAIKKNGKTTMYSRTGKEYKNFDLIRDQINALIDDDFVMDGEVVLNKGNESGLSIHFQPLMEIIRKKDYKITECIYLIFDMMSIDDFYGKKKSSYADRNMCYDVPTSGYLLRVHQFYVTDIDDLWQMAVLNCWEGLMLRNADAPYEGKRTNNLLKMKMMQDDEYTIIDVNEGGGKYAGMMGSITVLVDGCAVNVGSGFSDHDRKEMWNNRQFIIGQVATINYFEKTKDGSLRFPVFKCIR